MLLLYYSAVSQMLNHYHIQGKRTRQQRVEKRMVKWQLCSSSSVGVHSSLNSFFWLQKAPFLQDEKTSHLVQGEWAPLSCSMYRDIVGNFKEISKVERLWCQTERSWAQLGLRSLVRDIKYVFLLRKLFLPEIQKRNDETMFANKITKVRTLFKIWHSFIKTYLQVFLSHHTELLDFSVLFLFSLLLPTIPCLHSFPS